MKIFQSIKLTIFLVIGATSLSGATSALALPAFPAYCAGNECKWSPTNTFTGPNLSVESTFWGNPFYQSDEFGCSKNAVSCSVTKSVSTNTCQTHDVGTSTTEGTATDLKAAVSIFGVIEIGAGANFTKSSSSSVNDTATYCTTKVISYVCVMPPNSHAHVFSKYKFQKVKINGKRTYKLMYKQFDGTWRENGDTVQVPYAGTVTRPANTYTACAIVKY